VNKTNNLFQFTPNKPEPSACGSCQETD